MLVVKPVQGSSRRCRRQVGVQSALRQQPVLFAAQSGAHAAPTFLQEPLTVLRGLPADVRRLIAGAIAGAISKTSTAPIENVRVRLMTNSEAGFVAVIKSVWTKYGILGFWRGNDADVLRTMPSKAIELASYDVFKRVLSAARDPETGRPKLPPALISTLSGAMAGIATSFPLYPLETARTRLAIDGDKYRTLYGTLSTVVRQEGFGALYRGFSTSIIGAVPYTTVRLALFDGLKAVYRKAYHKDKVPPEASMACGAAAALVATAVTFPLEVVRRRAMGGQKYASPLGAFQGIIKEEGVAALFRGLPLTCAKQGPSQAVLFLAFDSFKGLLDVQDK